MSFVCIVCNKSYLSNREAEVCLNCEGTLEHKIVKLESQNRKLTEALMFYADPNNWDYYDSITEGSDIPENPSTRWNAVFLPDKNDSELLEGYGFLHEQAYVNGKLARAVLKEVENV